MNYHEAIRVDPFTLECPHDYRPCSIDTSPGNTICIGPDDAISHCPITFIDFIPVDTTAEEEDVVLPWNDSLNFVYSKKRDSLPIFSTHIGENIPCEDFSTQSYCEFDTRYRQLFDGQKDVFSSTPLNRSELDKFNLYSKRISSWLI